MWSVLQCKGASWTVLLRGIRTRFEIRRFHFLCYWYDYFRNEKFREVMYTDEEICNTMSVVFHNLAIKMTILVKYLQGVLFKVQLLIFHEAAIRNFVQQ